MRSDLEEPYRQRVYHVTLLEDGSIRSDIYEIRDPLRFAGDWKREAPLARLAPDSLLIRRGCAVILPADCDTLFVGSTVGHECESSLRGATYATSEITIRQDRLESWDRGFNSSGEQV